MILKNLKKRCVRINPYAIACVLHQLLIHDETDYGYYDNKQRKVQRYKRYVKSTFTYKISYKHSLLRKLSYDT
jgi:hypothetical protein